jgi:LmbE family N-acetylglucosaminyl deacetylase
MRVFFSPHLDDAVLSCFARFRPGDLVVTVFAGIPDPELAASAWDTAAGAASARAAVITRREEDLRATSVAGVRHRHLDFLEAPYRRAAPDLASIRAAMITEATGADEIWIPAGLGRHPDHTLTAALGLSLLGTFEATSINAYVDYPYWRIVQPGPGANDDLARTAALQAWYEHRLHSVPGLSGPVTVRGTLLDPAATAGKTAGASAYASQLNPLSTTCGGNVLDPAYLAREYVATLREGQSS